MKKNIPCVLTIAGSDSSGGAGIQADIKTMSALGCYAASVITALTAQNTLGAQAVYTVPVDFIAQQLESIFTDLPITVVKVGMLHDEGVIAVVAAALRKYSGRQIIFDPVMVAKNGCELLKPSALQFLKENFFSQLMLLTPNVVEAEKILNISISSCAEQAAAARALGENFGINVLVKGGHLMTAEASDVLYVKSEAAIYWFHGARIQTANTHGTGCTLSAAIAAFVAKGYALRPAIQAAKEYLTQALIAGKNFRIGRGCGPLNHFYFLESACILGQGYIL